MLRIWIDLDNAPHAAFFRPIVAELRSRGHRVMLSARDDGQTVALAREFGLDCEVVGGWRGRSLLAKLPATVLRALLLSRRIPAWAPQVAVSHGSRSMVLAAALRRIPAVTLYDYEGISTGLFHRFSDTLIVPELVPPRSLPGNGRSRVVRYGGLKEDIYLSDFEPSADVRAKLRIRPDEVLVVLRPESETAHYRAERKSPILEAVLDRVARAEAACVVLVPRTPEQGERVASVLARVGVRTIVPGVVDGRELIAAADLVISGGGTMTREAAVLGVPAYSIFRGELGAVDRWLAENGRLVLVRSAADVSRIRVEPSSRRQRPAGAGGELLRLVSDEICAAAGRAESGRRGHVSRKSSRS